MTENHCNCSSRIHINSHFNHPFIQWVLQILTKNWFFIVRENENEPHFLQTQNQTPNITLLTTMGRHKDKDKDRDHKKKKHKHKDSSRKKDKKKSSKKSSSKRKHDNVSDSYSSSGSDTSYASDNERMGELEGGWVEKSTGDIEEPKVVMESESRVEEEKPKLHRESWMSAPPPPRVAAKKEDEEKKRLEEEEKRRKEVWNV